MINNTAFDELFREYSSKTIAELKFIISNDHSHTVDQVNVANHVIGIKRTEWKKKNIETSKKIDKIIRNENWFDFHIIRFDSYRLMVGGSTDLSYYHTLEVIFEDIFFISGFFNGWSSDTDKIVFQIPDDEVELNRKYEIEQDYQLFTFRTENYKNDVLVAANIVTFNTDTVFYYNRSNLKQNERIADFVKKNTGKSPTR